MPGQIVIWSTVTTDSGHFGKRHKFSWSSATAGAHETYCWPRSVPAVPQIKGVTSITHSALRLQLTISTGDSVKKLKWLKMVHQLTTNPWPARDIKSHEPLQMQGLMHVYASSRRDRLAEELFCLEKKSEFQLSEILKKAEPVSRLSPLNLGWLQFRKQIDSDSSRMVLE